MRLRRGAPSPGPPRNSGTALIQGAFASRAAGRSRTIPAGFSRIGGMRNAAKDNPRGCSLRRAGAVRLRRGGSRTARLCGKTTKHPWIPAFAGMTGLRRRSPEGKSSPPFERRLQTGKGLAFRRHSGEGRNPEPARAAEKSLSGPSIRGPRICVPRCFSWTATRAAFARRPPLRDFRALPACEPGEGQPQGVLPTLRVVRWQKRARGSSVDPRARFLQMRAVRAKAVRAPRTSRRGSRRRRIGSCRFRSPRSGRRR